MFTLLADRNRTQAAVWKSSAKLLTEKTAIQLHRQFVDGGERQWRPALSFWRVLAAIEQRNSRRPEKRAGQPLVAAGRSESDLRSERPESARPGQMARYDVRRDCGA